MPTDVKETKAEPKKLKITLIKSTIGAVPKNRKENWYAYRCKRDKG